MGYTHHFEFEKSIEGFDEETLEILEDIAKRYSDIIVAGEEKVVKEDIVFFNGKNEQHEPLFVDCKRKGRDFCKTARKEYDVVVCEILAVLFAKIPEFAIKSDGFWLPEKDAKKFQETAEVNLDGTWNEALDNIKELYNIELDWELDISDSGGYTYYHLIPKKEKQDLKETLELSFEEYGTINAVFNNKVKPIHLDYVRQIKEDLYLIDEWVVHFDNGIEALVGLCSNLDEYSYISVALLKSGEVIAENDFDNLPDKVQLENEGETYEIDIKLVS